jgi:lipoprotein-releasing system ATP-binding protein
MSLILEGRDIKKSIGESEILKEISVGISKRDFVSIVGSPGSGKSSLMYILGLLDAPTSSDVIMDEKRVDFSDAKLLSKMRNRKIGFVFQFHYLITELTAYENVLIPMLKNGTNSKLNEKERCYNIIESLSLKGMEDRTPFQMSGGEQQRVAIARALANDPEIIMADEPTGNLDSKNSAAVMDKFL